MENDLPVIPAPLDLVGTSNSNTDAGNGGDEGVGGGDVGGVTGAPHNPGGSGGEGTSESKHLDAGVALEGGRGDDAVLDGLSGSGTDSDGADGFEDGRQAHGS